MLMMIINMAIMIIMIMIIMINENDINIKWIMIIMAK